MNARTLATSSILISLTVAMRWIKNILTSFQFVNISLVLAYLGSFFYGPFVGFLVGSMSYVVSDLLIFPGPWTVVNAALAGLVAYIFGVLKKFFREYEFLFVLAFILTFLFDLLSSSTLYIVFGLNLFDAVFWGFVGLFLPVTGGGIIGVGPLTEFVTSFLCVFLIKALESRGVVYGQTE